MAKKIRFPLEMKDGVEVRDIEELKENFSLEHILVYYSDGKLVTWLRDRYQDGIADAVLALDREDADFYKKICSIFEADYSEEQAEEMGKAEERNRKRALLKEVTDEEKFYEVLDQIAFTQDDLYDLLDEGITEIYLCGKKFTIPLGKEGVKYIGVNSPVAVISSKEKVDFEEKNIALQGVLFDEKYAGILSAEASATVEMLSDEAWEQIKLLIADLGERVDSFLERTIKKYKPKRIMFKTSISVHISYYSSYQFLFQTETAAKVGCKRVIRDFVMKTYDAYESQRDEAIDECRYFVECIKSDIMDFVMEFTSAYEKFICEDCGNDARTFAEKQMETIVDRGRLMKQYEDFDFCGKLESYIQELFMPPIDKEERIKEYFHMCTYGFGRNMYSYIINKAIDSIADNVKEFHKEACETMEGRLKGLYQSILTDYCDGIKEELSAVRRDAAGKSRNGRYDTPDWLDLGAIFGLALGKKSGNADETKKTDVSSWWDKHLEKAHKGSD